MFRFSIRGLLFLEHQCKTPGLHEGRAHIRTFHGIGKVGSAKCHGSGAFGLIYRQVAHGFRKSNRGFRLFRKQGHLESLSGHIPCPYGQGVAPICALGVQEEGRGCGEGVFEGQGGPNSACYVKGPRLPYTPIRQVVSARFDHQV